MLNTGVAIKTAVLDMGCRGHETWPGARLVLPGHRGRTPGERRPLAPHPAVPARRHRGVDRAHEGRLPDGPQLAQGHRRRRNARDSVRRRS